ncbi:MAG: GxxExxY protein, partial [Acidobacteria bacterium]|nr:GxxExxY protein [Acidobacteriota bacterium]
MDCAFTVHRALGPGFREKIYVRALCLELDAQKLKFETDKNILVRYKQWQIPGQTVDLLVESSVLVEAKVVPRLRPMHRLQVLSYLKTLNLRIGLLINFNVPVLEDGFKRVIRQGGTAERHALTRRTTTGRLNEEAV